MTALGQIRHVMMKDLREAQWPLFVYAIIVAAATGHALSWPPMSSSIFDSSMLFVVVAGMVLVALFVQADSPTRSDAFWASRPFSPASMLAAKIVLILVVVIGLPLVGQFLALWSRGVSGATAVLDTGSSAWQYALWLLVAMIIAALTRDLRTFAVMLIATPLFLVIVAALVGSPTRAPVFSANHPPTARWKEMMPLLIAPVVGAGGGLWLLVHLYRARDSRRRMWVAGLVVVAGAFVGVAATAPTPRPMSSAPTSVQRTPIKLELMDYAHPETRPELVLWLYRGASTTERWTLTRSVVVVQLRSGATLRLPYANQFVELGQPLPPSQPGATWLEAPRDVGARTQVNVVLSDADRRAVVGGITSVSIEGTLEIREPHFVAAIPLEPGAFIRRDGHDVRVSKATHAFGDASVELVTSSLVERNESPSSASMWGGAVNYALLNEARGEALALNQRGSSGGSGSLVLPGVNIRSETIQLQSPGRSAGAPALVDDMWFRSLRLMIWNWTETGSYPIQAEFIVP